MRTFIIRARKLTVQADQLRSNIGKKGHFEVIAHSIMNAFFISNDFREDVEIYIVLDSAHDFPRTIQLSSNISLDGFHEEAMFGAIENALRESQRLQLQKNETHAIAPGLHVSGFGFERLVSELIKTRPIYLLNKKGEDIRTVELATDPVFILSDHLALPKNSIKAFRRHGLKMLSLGKKMLFSSQCILILNYEMDRK